MINAAMVGLGWWGQTLVESVEDSDIIRFTAGTTRTKSDEVKAFAETHKFDLKDSFEDVIADPSVDAVVLATPHSMHSPQVVAAAEAGKHVFCEKPFTLTKQLAEVAVEATDKAGVALAVGFNRRFHPTMKKVDEMSKGELGTLMHIEGTMTFPNAKLLTPAQWRANADETPCGGLTPMGVHIVDSMIQMAGEIDEVFCLSHRRFVQIDNDDTTAILFKFKNGMTGYLGTLTATGGSYRYQVFGSEGWVRLDGMAHIAGASSLERRSQLFANMIYQPAKGAQESREVESYDVSRAVLEAFGTAADGGAPFPIPTDEMIHGAAAIEAIVKSANSGQLEKVG